MIDETAAGTTPVVEARTSNDSNTNPKQLQARVRIAGTKTIDALKVCITGGMSPHYANATEAESDRRRAAKLKVDSSRESFYSD